MPSEGYGIASIDQSESRVESPGVGGILRNTVADRLEADRSGLPPGSGTAKVDSTHAFLVP